MCWLNPPYSQVRDFIAKAAAEAARGCTVVALVPARTDTRWWHAQVWDELQRTWKQGVEARFVRGRLKFGGAGNGAPFPSVVLVFRPTREPRGISFDGCLEKGASVSTVTSRDNTTVEAETGAVDGACSLRVCAAVVRYEGSASIYCAAQADETGFCAVHRQSAQTPVKPRPSRSSRSSDSDVLPWSDDDRAVFAARVGTQTQARPVHRSAGDRRAHSRLTLHDQADRRQS